MSDFFVFEGSDDVVNAVDLLDVAQEMVAETFALRGASDQTCDVDDLEDGADFRFGFPHFTEFVESFIWDRHYSLVGFDGTEGVIFCRDIEFGENVVSGGFTDVRESDNTHFEGVSGTTPEDFQLSSLFFFWWH